MSRYGATDDQQIPLESPNEYTNLREGFDQAKTTVKSFTAELIPHNIEKVQPIFVDWDDMTSNKRRLLRELFAEFFGTCLFVFLGTGSVAATVPFEGRLSSASVVVIALGFGFGITTMIYATAGISGGHLNPAVTVAIMLARKITVVKGFLYIIMQCVGAILGSAFLAWSLPKELCIATNYGATTLTRNGTFGHSGQLTFSLTDGGAMLIEIILTFFLVFVIFATASLPGDEKKMGSFAPQAIGLSVLAGHLVAIPFTGPSMNPARSFGPAVVGGIWADHWVYWVGPLVGGAVASVLYTLILSSQVEQTKAEMEQGTIRSNLAVPT